MPSRRPSRQLVQLFEHSPVPIYVVDDGRRIVYCNAACARWLGIESARLVGQTCTYHSGDAGSSLAEAAAALCPPLQAFQGERADAHVVWRDSGGIVEQREAVFLPLGAGESECQGVIAVLADRRPVPDRTPASAVAPSSQELHERLQQMARQLRARYRLDRLVGDSLAMRRVREQVRLAIVGRARVLILGPPGSGREHVARTIHGGENPELAGPILPLACPIVDAEILSSSVSDFLRRCPDPGAKSSATLLLLDADGLTPQVQAEMQVLLRSSTFATRVIATARRPLIEMAERGDYLPELAFALSPLVIQLPALRDRREDIPLLAQRFVEEFNAAGGKQLAGLAPAALDRLASLPWTGTVEELAEVVGEACRQVTGVWIGESDLPERVRAVTAAGAHPRRTSEAIQLDAFLLDVERELIQRAMKRSRGNKARAARMLGVSRPRLLRRLAQLGLETRPSQQIDFKLVEDDVADPDDSTG
jgi:transcriptional regulator with PAS, ATPase and Fis domain